MSVPNFTNFPSEVSGALLSGSNGLSVAVVTGTPDKIVISAPNLTGVNSITATSLSGTSIAGAAIVTPLLNVSSSAGYGSVEVGGAQGGYIDFKKPFSDDSDLRVISDNTIEGGGYITNAGGAVLSLSGANVGIGTTSPATKLDVQDANNVSIRTRETVNGVDTRLQSLGLTANAGIIGTFSNHPLVVYTNNSEKIRIESGGNVGIGTNSPATKLHINGGAGAGSGNEIIRLQGNDTWVSFYTGSGATRNAWVGFGQGADTNVFSITNEKSGGQINIIGSKIGINNLNPATELDVNGTITSRSNNQFSGLSIRNSTNIIASIFGDSAGNENGLLELNSNGVRTIQLFSAGNSYMLSGNVGIGTSSPSQKLSVNGNISADGIVFGSTGVSVTSKTLEDYEEGTWTPGLQGTFVSSPTFADRYGYYIKTGKLVHLWFFIHLASSTGAGGTLEINGLPYTAGPAQGQATLDYINGFNTAFSASITGYSYSTIYFNKTIAGSSTNLTSTDTTTDFIIYGTANFRTS